MEQSTTGQRRNTVLLFAVGIALLAIIGYGLYTLSGGGGSVRPKPPKISLLPNTPPPPPPPKDERKPEPPKEQKEVKMEQPEQKQAPPPDSEKVMDGPKGDAPSDFKAGTVTKEDYSTKPATIGGGAGARSTFTFYTALIKRQLDEELAKNKQLRNSEYRVALKIWLASSGKITRVELMGSSGNAQTDEALKVALTEMGPLREPPPDNMPQPVRLRITARGAG